MWHYEATKPVPPSDAAEGVVTPNNESVWRSRRAGGSIVMGHLRRDRVASQRPDMNSLVARILVVVGLHDLRVGKGGHLCIGRA